MGLRGGTGVEYYLSYDKQLPLLAIMPYSTADPTTITIGEFEYPFKHGTYMRLCFSMGDLLLLYLPVLQLQDISCIYGESHTRGILQELGHVSRGDWIESVCDMGLYWFVTWGVRYYCPRSDGTTRGDATLPRYPGDCVRTMTNCGSCEELISSVSFMLGEVWRRR